MPLPLPLPLSMPMPLPIPMPIGSKPLTSADSTSATLLSKK
jgi:hypothetical protein